MRIGPFPETLREWAAVLLRRGPRPMLETHTTLMLAQTVMTATRLGVFEALAAGERSAAEVAAACGSDRRATAALLDALAATAYVGRAGDGYRLTAAARRWLLAASRESLRDSILFRFAEWEWIGRLEPFVRTGEAIDIHGEMTAAEWDLYLRGMRALAAGVVAEAARRTPVPRGARALLDVGGAHGLFAAALCRRHGELRAEVLDLPAAVVAAAPLLAAEGLGARLVHRCGDAQSDDLGCEAYDVILVSNLMHHLDPAAGRDLVARAARALRPGGVLVLQEVFAGAERGSGGQAAALTGLYFALTSEAGTRSRAEFVAWQRDAGLVPRRQVHFVSMPGGGQQNAIKPGLPRRWFGRRAQV